MKSLFHLLVVVLLAGACEATEIVAWKVPLSRFAEHGRWTEGMVRCKAAPEASPFFKEDDEMWDLNGISPALRKQTSPPLEWMIWNASTGRLVVRAELDSIWQLCQRLQPNEQPKHCRLTVEVLEVDSDGGPPPESMKAPAGFSWVTRSAKEFEASRESKGRMIRVRGLARMDEDSLLADIQIEIACSVENQPEMKFKSSFPIISGKPIWLARDFDGKKGMDLRISSSFELLDGTQVSDIMQIQNGNQLKPIKLDRHEFKKYRIGTKSSLAVQYFTPNDLIRFSPSTDFSADPFGEEDPFSESPSEGLREKLGVLEVRPPEVVRTWFDGRVLDILSIIRPTGILSDETTAFAGYDPLTKTIFLLSDDPSEVDKFEQILNTSCHFPPRIVIATFDGRRQTRLVSRSDTRCSLERSLNEQHVIRSFMIEPAIESDGTIDMRIDYSDESNDGQKQFLKSSVTLEAGKSSVLLEESLGNSRSAQLKLEAFFRSVND